MSSPRWFLLASLPILLLITTGCERLAKPRLSGTYYRAKTEGETNAIWVMEELSFTDTKCVLNIPSAGAIASDYSVEDDVIYIGGPTGQIRFTIDGFGVISNKGTAGMEGTYIKLQK